MSSSSQCEGLEIAADIRSPPAAKRRRRLRLHAVIAAVWISLSLAVLCYVAVEGEHALAEFDGFDLVTTYVLQPLAPE
jgi:hypothetical protein